MANVLIVAEHAAGELRKPTLHALAAGREVARRSGGRLYVAVLGSGLDALAERLRAYADVLCADAPVLANYLAEAYAPVAAEAARAVQASYVGAAATAFGRDLVPRLAHLLGAATASDVLAFDGEGQALTFRRSMWAGAVIAEVELATPVKAFTVRASEFPAAQVAAAAGSRTAVPVRIDPAALRTRFVERRSGGGSRPELSEAKVVVAGGRGTKGDFRQVELLADALGGAVGATRAATDAGWAPHAWQIGQTGTVIAPELYIAAGIAGATQHLAGIKGSKVIVAVNKDPDAPIFQIADYGLVADLFQALPELCRKVKASE